MNPLMTRVNINYQIATGVDIIEYHIVGDPISRKIPGRQNFSVIREIGYVFTDEILADHLDRLSTYGKKDLFAMIPSINGRVPVILRGSFVTKMDIEGHDIISVEIITDSVEHSDSDYYKKYMEERDIDEDLY